MHKALMQNDRTQVNAPDPRFLLGLSQLALALAAELTDTIGHVHGNVHASIPMAPVLRRSAVARYVYALVKGGFLLPSRASGLIAARLPQREPQAGMLAAQSAINGVFGHILASQNNPLAFPMSFRNASVLPGKPLLVFVHGLCLHEQNWMSPAHIAFVDEMQAAGFGIAHARYNSGLAIAENGSLLSALLEETGASRLVLVGHSMGGLIIRSALHQAMQAGLDWPERLTHVVALGSPHQGAEAERVGNYANRLLTLTPWSAPLARLGNLRSDAIRDLRFGSLLHSDRERAGDPLHTHDPRTPIPLPDSVAHLFVAGTRSAEGARKKLRSDLLVTPDSALAEGYPGTGSLHRELFFGMDHFQLMREAPVYALLHRWINAGA